MSNFGVIQCGKIIIFCLNTYSSNWKLKISNYYLSKTYNVTVSANPTKQQFNQSNQLDDINSSNFYSKNFYKFNFTEISDYLFYYNEFIKDTMNTSGKIHMVLMGPIRLRFVIIFLYSTVTHKTYYKLFKWL